MFPISFDGQFELDVGEPVEIDDILSRFMQALSAKRATRVLREDHEISFRGGLFRFATGLNLLAMVGRGNIRIIPGDRAVLQYRFSCVQMLVIATVLIAIVIVREDLPLLVSPVAGFWLFGANYWMASQRLSSFVKKTISPSSRRAIVLLVGTTITPSL